MRSTFARLCWLKNTLLAGPSSSYKKSDAVLRVFRRKHLLRGSIVLSHCVLPLAHFGQDLVYSGITKINGKEGKTLKKKEFFARRKKIQKQNKEKKDRERPRQVKTFIFKSDTRVSKRTL